MNRIRKFTYLFPFCLLWLMLCVFFWSWIFTFLTDTTPEKKITLFSECSVSDETALSLYLEKDLPENIKMVKVHPFSYAMMDSSVIENSDLYIARASFADEYRDWLRPVPADLFSSYEIYYSSDIPIGICVYDGKTKAGAGAEYLTYVCDGNDTENYYLFLSSSSVHISGNENAIDNEAVNTALRFLALSETN